MCNGSTSEVNGSTPALRTSKITDVNGRSSASSASQSVEATTGSQQSTGTQERTDTITKAVTRSATTLKTFKTASTVAGIASAVSEVHLSRDLFAKGVNDVISRLICDHKVQKGKYNRDSWFRTILTMQGRAPMGPPFYAVVIFTTIVVAFVEFTFDDPDEKKHYFKLSITPFSLVGGGLMFLVVFRTMTSYGKWVESRKNWANLSVLSRDLGIQACTYIHDKRIASRICRYCIAFLIACKCWLRSEDIEEALVAKIMTESGLERIMEPYQDKEDLDISHVEGSFEVSHDARTSWKRKSKHLSWQFLKPCAPLVCLEVIRECIMEAVELRKVGPFHMAMENNVKAFGQKLVVFERILSTRIPFAYISHLRTSVLLYLTALPFFLVNALGWVTVPSVTFIAYVIIGLENVSIQIENPFGYDENDLPMDEYCAEIAQDLRDICRRCWKIEDNYGRGGLRDDEAEENELVAYAVQHDPAHAARGWSHV